MQIISDKVPKAVRYILIFACLSSLANSLPYISETVVKSSLLSKMTYEGRSSYVDGIYNKSHGGTAYEFSTWAGRLIPPGYSYTLHRSPTDPPDEHEKYDFWNYYAWLNYNLYPRITQDYGKRDFPPPYGDIVFSISLKPSLMKIAKDNILFTSIEGEQYYIVARFDRDIFLLINGDFIKSTILKEPQKWSVLFSEFNKLYPGRHFRPVFEAN